jgi:L-histidine N-alpha-methyltransferase
LCYSAGVPGTRLTLERTSTAPLEERLSVRRVGAEGAQATFADDVRRGLTATPKRLDPKYFYDELGSRLFEAITALPEYYVTRSEAEVLRQHAGDIAAALGGPLWLVELGSGDGQKTRLLIEALLARQESLEYVPVDISESAVEISSRALLLSYPDLRITAYIGEYHAALRRIRKERAAPGCPLVLFLGSTLGNMNPEERLGFVREVRKLLNAGEGFLLGVDLQKPEKVLIPAYDDPLGVTAAFNLNLLVRINRELGGAFDIATFRHRAVYNREVGRIEMHLVSRQAQTVPIGALGIEVPFAAGETIHTESSYKFRGDQIIALAAETGFELRRAWTDSKGWFASNLLVAV